MMYDCPCSNSQEDYKHVWQYDQQPLRCSDKWMKMDDEHDHLNHNQEGAER